MGSSRCQTVYSCKNKIKNLKLVIEAQKQIIAVREAELKQVEKRIKEIEAYENSHSIEQRTLKKYINQDAKTVELLDEFEKANDEGIKKYSRILDTGAWYYTADRRYQFIIERLEGRKCVGDITMTNYKTRNHNRALIDYAKEQIKQFLDNNDVDAPTEIMFEQPFLIRGQKSSNRRGYGSEYNGNRLVKKGTLYGETTDYAIVGVKYIKWNK